MWGEARTVRQVDNHRVRPEIQALRALAVTLVVVYHFDSRILPGGYIGVDVFFVISGFLITGHIAKGLQKPEKFKLGQFYIRRVRRLLPAALVVLAVVSLVTLLRLPETSWNATGRQVIASVLYVQNWELASNSVDYLAASSPPTPVQHFWSLSVEEQFYFFWPITLILAAWAGRRLGRVRFTLVSCVAVLVALSFTLSIWQTFASPSWAYFITPTRIWELGAGGLLALTMPQLRASRWIRGVLSWVGVATILLCGFAFSSATAFPGYVAALPVLATGLVITAGNVAGSFSTSRISNLRVTQFIGDISYSIYLWHWPLLVMIPLIINGPGYKLPIPLRPLPLLICLVTAWLSKKYIEDPFRVGVFSDTESPRAVHRKRLLVGSLITLTVCTLTSSGFLYGVSQSRIDRADIAFAAFNAAMPECAGAASLSPHCAGYEPNGIQPSPLIASTDSASPGCQQKNDRSALIRCEFGDGQNATREVAVLGDSHANQWIGAIQLIARQKNWHVTSYLKSGCAFALALGSTSCQEFNRAVTSELRDNHVDLVITSAASGIGYGEFASAAEAAPKFAAAWRQLASYGTRVIAIQDTPQPRRAGIHDPPGYVDSGKYFRFPLAKGLGDDALIAATQQSGAPLVDMNDWICVAAQCTAVIGGVLVYRDSSHITSTYSRTLANELEKKLTISLG